MAAAMSLLRLGLSRGPLCPKRSLWAKWMVATKVPHVPPVRLTANVAPMELMFYFPSDPTVIFQDERNRGIEALPDLLTEIERFGARVLRVDLSSLSAEQRFHEYVKATIPAIHKRYEVKRMFGTARHSACWFGIQVPALFGQRDRRCRRRYVSAQKIPEHHRDNSSVPCRRCCGFKAR